MKRVIAEIPGVILSYTSTLVEVKLYCSNDGTKVLFPIKLFIPQSSIKGGQKIIYKIMANDLNQKSDEIEFDHSNEVIPQDDEISKILKEL